MQPLRKKLGQQIALLRKEAGLTQEQLAEQTGYSVDFIGLIERGINAPTVDGLERFADVLQVGVPDLFRLAGGGNRSKKRRR